MQKRYLVFFLLLSLPFAGCLISEVTQYTLVLNKDLKSGTFTVTRRNVESNATDAATQHKDFRELLANWKSDGYLLDQMEKGLYVKKRAVRIEKNKLVWSETAIFSDITRLIPNFNLNDTLRFPLHDTTGLVITTNGMLSTSSEGAAIKWNPHTTTFSVTTRMREFNPTSSFAEQLRRYLKR
jgi:hypothetical protein